MSRSTFDQASKQNFVVNIQDSEFGKLVVRWRERDIWHENSFEIMFWLEDSFEVMFQSEN